MLLGLHTGTILHTNLVTDIRVARESGYEAIELYTPKLLRYLDAGYDVAQLPPLGIPEQRGVLHGGVHHLLRQTRNGVEQALLHQAF